MPLDAPLYPVNLVLAGRRCVVVGGGAVAARKVRGLLAAGALVAVVAPEIGEEIRALAAAAPGPDKSNLTVAERPYAATDLEGAWLVVTATDRPDVNATVRADADAAHLWCNAADDPTSCSFTLPAIARQGPITVAVSTSGYSPALATWIRDLVAEEVEQMLGPEYATLASLLAEARAALQASGRSTEGVDWRPVLGTGMLDAIRAGDLARAKRHLEDCLSSSQD